MSEKKYCDDRFEEVVFLLKDKDHEFSLSLESVLECIIFAVKKGNLPKLPKSWCAVVKKRFNIDFDENVMI